MERTQEQHDEYIRFEKKKLLLEIYKDLIKAYTMKIRVEFDKEKVDEYRTEIFELLDLLSDV